MIDPASIAALKGACDLAIGAIPQIFPLVHDENTRKRLLRLDALFRRIEDGTITTEELAEAKDLLARVRVHALMTENATVLAYLEIGLLLLEAHKSATAEQPVDLIMFDDDDFEERSTRQSCCGPPSPVAASIKSVTTTADLTKFIILGKHSLLVETDACSVDEGAQAGTTLPPYTPAASHPSSPSQHTASTESHVPEATADGKKPKSHPRLKQAACWGLVLTVGPTVLLAPQVRRNLRRSKGSPE